MMKNLKIGELLARVPIVQGGMGVGISMSRLASAVANEGGIGVISVAGLGLVYKDYSSDFNKATLWGLKEEIRKARKASKGVIGVNIMVAMTDFANLVKTAVAEVIEIGKKAKPEREDKKLTKLQRERRIAELTEEMREAAKALEFERAAYLRDRIKELRNGK